jgi:hypothetical protein
VTVLSGPDAIITRQIKRSNQTERCGNGEGGIGAF